jgi:ATP-dependent exoDNAse (exonuclease V) beta subunit
VARTATQVAGEVAGGTGVGEAPAAEPSGSPSSAAVALIEMPVAAQRPAGPRFGALVHASLSLVPLDADAGAIEQIARLQARILGADDGELASAVTVVAAVLHHPILERARAAEARGACRRETPVAWRRPDGVLIEGVVDLAFLEDDGWVVLDFKTDRDIARDLPRYREQVAIYARAIVAATGTRARGVLLRV